jgi:hypothetical protein
VNTTATTTVGSAIHVAATATAAAAPATTTPTTATTPATRRDAQAGGTLRSSCNTPRQLYGGAQGECMKSATGLEHTFVHSHTTAFYANPHRYISPYLYHICDAVGFNM